MHPLGWVLLHLAFLAAVVATGWLGWWQWDRAHEAGGTFRNLGYALQWPLFGLFAIFLWYQVVRMITGADHGKETTEPVAEPNGLRRTDVESASHSNHRPRRSPVPPPAPPVNDQEDPELAEYNRYLASLNAEHSD